MGQCPDVLAVDIGFYVVEDLELPRSPVGARSALREDVPSGLNAGRLEALLKKRLAERELLDLCQSCHDRPLELEDAGGIPRYRDVAAVRRDRQSGDAGVDVGHEARRARNARID